MIGAQRSEAQLFSYAVNLEKRVRANPPLRQVKAAIAPANADEPSMVADRLRIGSASYVSNLLSSVDSKL